MSQNPVLLFIDALDPEALKTITSNQCLSNSAFLNPALQAVMAHLRPTMMVQVAVRLIAIALRLIGETLPAQDISLQCEYEQQKPSETVRRELDHTLPHYQWQGPRNYCGRIQYLMALLGEAIRVLAVTEALKVDKLATLALERVSQSRRRLQNVGYRGFVQRFRVRRGASFSCRVRSEKARSERPRETIPSRSTDSERSQHFQSEHFVKI